MIPWKFLTKSFQTLVDLNKRTRSKEAPIGLWKGQKWEKLEKSNKATYAACVHIIWSCCMDNTVTPSWNLINAHAFFFTKWCCVILFLLYLQGVNSQNKSRFIMWGQRAFAFCCSLEHTIDRGPSGTWYDLNAGQEEGVYSWVAVNYALGSLGSEPQETTGIVELGGASMQVLFIH